MNNIIERLNPRTSFEKCNPSKTIRQFCRIYGEFLLARILGCKTGMLKRAIAGKPMFTHEQISKLNFLLLIEEKIAENSIRKKKTGRQGNTKHAAR